MIDACKRAKIKPRISFHGLRHTWASLTVMGLQRLADRIERDGIEHGDADDAILLRKADWALISSHGPCWWSMPLPAAKPPRRPPNPPATAMASRPVPP